MYLVNNFLSLFNEIFFQTLSSLLIAGLIAKLLWSISRKQMATRRSEAYLRVLSYFISQPKQGPARKRSFEYMEMAVGERDKSGDEEDKKERKESRSKDKNSSPDLDGNHKYLECIDTSQSHDNDVTIAHNPSNSSGEGSRVQPEEWSTEESRADINAELVK